MLMTLVLPSARQVLGKWFGGSLRIYIYIYGLYEGLYRDWGYILGYWKNEMEPTTGVLGRSFGLKSSRRKNTSSTRCEVNAMRVSTRSVRTLREHHPKKNISLYPKGSSVLDLLASKIIAHASKLSNTPVNR